MHAQVELAGFTVVNGNMVHVCAVPGCSNRSDRQKELSYYTLPLRKKKLLKVWIHKIGRKNLPLNINSRVCSIHFSGSSRRRLRPDEYPVAHLPFTNTELCKRKPPTKRIRIEKDGSGSESEYEQDLAGASTTTNEIGVQTEDQIDLLALISELKSSLHACQFRLSTFAHLPQKMQFYTGFSDYKTFRVFYDSLGLAVDCLNYWGSEIVGDAKSIQ